MRFSRSCMVGGVAGAALSASALGQANLTIPADFETPGSELGRLFSYFGGVASYSTSRSDALMYEGGSCALAINFQHDTFFRVAGVGVGTLGMNRPALNVPAGADTFSVTIDWPFARSLSLKVTVREDDNNDGLIDAAGEDDQWETGVVMLQQGVHVYNLPAAAFDDVNADSGNNTRNFSTTNRMAMILTFESRTTYPGGIIETPVTLGIDHAGFFVGAQTIPPPRRRRAARRTGTRRAR